MLRPLATLTIAALALPTLAIAEGKGLSDKEFEAILKERGAKVPIGAVLTDEQFEAYSEKVAKDVASDRLDRFRLFNTCRPMELTIEELVEDEVSIGLTEKALQAAAESRLRAARLYTKDNIKAHSASLYVNVKVVGQAFVVSVWYFKGVADEFGVFSTAVTWYTGSTGTHGRNAGFILSSLSRHLDKFLADYLRVNEAACEAR